MFSMYQSHSKPKRPVIASKLSTVGQFEGTLETICSNTTFGQATPMTSLLSRLANDPVLRTLNAAPPRPSELPDFYQIVLDQVGSAVAPYEVVKGVYDHNRASILVLYGNDISDLARPEIIGILTVLYLSAAGEAALADGTFTARAISKVWLCAAEDEPAAIYAWAIAGSSRLGRIRAARVAQYLSYDLFGGYNQYGYAATTAGQTLMEKLEFVDATRELPDIRPGTYVRWGRTTPRVGGFASTALPSSNVRQ